MNEGLGKRPDSRRDRIVQQRHTWGLILYGTIETIRSIRNTVSARVAMSLSPVPLYLTEKHLDD